jgi:hypothetical protein
LRLYCNENTRIPIKMGALTIKISINKKKGGKKEREKCDE